MCSKAFFEEGGLNVVAATFAALMGLVFFDGVFAHSLACWEHRLYLSSTILVYRK